MIKALIVDDEELARRGLELRLAQFDDIEICGQSRNGREALIDFREHSPDVMFLDVQMPGMDGFDVLQQLAGSEMPVVIFVTAYDEFALKAFDANALDYLLKPINDERLAEAIERARQALGNRSADEQRDKQDNGHAQRGDARDVVPTSVGHALRLRQKYRNAFEGVHQHEDGDEDFEVDEGVGHRVSPCWRVLSLG